jgi:hypothetical protein
MSKVMGLAVDAKNPLVSFAGEKCPFPDSGTG